jgi:hypothetical protein
VIEFQLQGIDILKPPRYSLDDWDRAMMERDRRVTGSANVQSVKKQADIYSKASLTLSLG